MMTGLGMFLDTVDDLRGRSGLRAAEYDVLQAAGLVRRLLTDDNPLYLVPAREFREKLRFFWNNSYSSTGRYLYAVSQSDPDIAEHIIVDRSGDPSGEPDLQRFGRSHTHELTLDQFLAQIVLARHIPNSTWPPVNPDDAVKVKHLLGHYSNRRAVHWDSRPPEHALFAEALEDETTEYLLRQALAAIGRVTVRAMEPLAARAFDQLQMQETRRRFSQQQRKS